MSQKFANKQCLVTGAAGFIGSHVVEALLGEGATVRAFIHYNSRHDTGHIAHLAENKALEVFAGDISDPFAVSEAVRGCDYVFHLAALIGIPYSYHAPASYVETNICGTLNILEAARRHHPTRVMVTSTSEVYGTGQVFPMSEEHPLNAQSPYAATKIGADQLALSYAASFGTPAVVVRPFNTYGPRQSRRAVIPTILGQIVAAERAGVSTSEPVAIKLGDLRPRRDFVFAPDTAQGFLAAALAEAPSEEAPVLGEVFNLATGNSVSIEELLQTIERVSGRKTAASQEDERKRPGKSEVWHLEGDASRAQTRLGWSAQASLEDGLRATLEWLRANMDEQEAADSYRV